MMTRRGIDEVELSVLLALWSVSVIAAEVFTGALADRVPRTRVLIASRLLKGSCFLAWTLLPGFWGYLAGFVCWGSASSLRSGAEESMLHDQLLAMGRRDQFEKVYGRAVASGQVGAFVSFVIGGFLAARTGFALPLGLSVAGPWLGAVLVATAMSDPPRSLSRMARPERYVEVVRAGLGEARSSSVLLQIVAVSASVACVWGVAEELLPVYLEEKAAFTLAAMGVVLASTSGVGVIASTLAHRVPARSPEAIAVVFALANGLLLASVAVDGLLAVALLVSSAGVNGSAAVLLAAHLQRSIRGPARATVTSIVSMGQELGGVLLYLVIGVLASMTSWHAGIGMVSGVAVVLCLVFAMVRRPLA